MKFTFKEINNSREALSRLNAEASQAAQEVAIAEQNLTNLESTEGPTPEEIYERTEAARRKLTVMKIAAQQSEAKRAIAQTSFEKVIKDSVDPLIAVLTEKANERAEQLKAKITPLIGDHAAASQEYREVIMQAAGVRERLDAAYRIKLSAGYSQGIPGAKPDLVANVLNAETLI